MRRWWVIGFVATALLGGCGSEDALQTDDEEGAGSDEAVAEAEAAVVSAAVDPRRSLAVTDAPILAAFPMEEVFNQLAAHGAPGQTGLSLFHQLWDTQNPGPGLGLGPHCDDGAGLLNGFPYTCRPGEGVQATVDPFANPDTNPNAYLPIGLFNRFDLAPKDGADCGEHRIVYAKRSGITDTKNRVLVIFEAVLPNPRTDLGIEGCRPVADFWRGLSSIADPAERASALHAFYFDGLPGFLPVVHPDNYGAGVGRPTGQLRTNQFMQSPWTLREFSIQRQATSRLVFAPASVKGNPFGDLFNPASTNARAAAFQSDFFPGAVENLAMNDINRFAYRVPDEFNVGQSDATAGLDDYVTSFGDGGALKTAIQTKLTELGSALTPNDIVARARAISCAGCHRLSNGANLGGGLVWPSSIGFTHITERTTEAGPDGARFALSPALEGVFLPARQQGFDYYFVPSFNEAYTFVPAPASGWSADPDFWESLSYPDLNGDAKADVCGKSGSSFYCALSLGNTFGPMKLWANTKSGAWLALPGQEKPIAFADVNGDAKADVCGRSGAGIWCALSTGAAFGAPSIWSADYDDVKGWKAHDSNWKSIKFPDIDGDGKADVCGRAGDGIHCARSTGSTFGPVALWSASFADTAAWPSIEYADLDADGDADVCARGPSGVHCARSNGTTFEPASAWGAGYEGDGNEAYEDTTRLPDVNGDGKSDVCGRGASGLWCALSKGSP